MALTHAPDGGAVVAYRTYNGGTQMLSIHTRYRSAPDGTWADTLPATAVDVPSGDSLGAPQLLADQNGVFTVLWSNSTGGGTSYTLTARRGAEGKWDAAETIPNSTGAVANDKFGAAIDASGNIQVAFNFTKSFAPSEAHNIRAAVRDASTNTWSTALAELLSSDASTEPSTPDVVYDSAGNANITFGVGLPPNSTTYVFYRAAGTSTYGPAPAPPGAVAPQLTTDTDGYLTATWTSGGQTYTSVYDAVNPSIDSVTPPTNPLATQPTNFVIAGSDVWGPVTYTLNFGDGSPIASGRAVPRAATFATFARVNGGGTVAHTYSTAGNFIATISVTDGATNTVTTTRPIAVGAAPTTSAPTQQAPTAQPTANPPAITGLPNPVAGVSANVLPVKPVVLIKTVGTNKFVPLVTPAQVKMGSIIDARKGRVRITIANGRGGFDTADFYEGIFKITQPKAKLGTTWFANLFLFAGSFKGCPKAPRNPKLAAFGAKKKPSPKRSVRHLWGNGKGAFRTVGRFSSATVRGTTWLTDDRCNGTLTRVTSGKVAVRDFVKKKTVVIKARQKYFAQAKAR
jgi:hypothetical protein